jgi:uncharacterized repeat protein (TIGR01451 family)
VQQRAAVSVSGVAATYTAGEGISYNIPFTVTNQGNGSDSYALSATLPAGWTSVFYIDADADNAYDVGEEVTSTAVLAAGGSVNTIQAWVSIPANAPSSTGNNVVITATSNFDESTLGGGAVNANITSSQTQVVAVLTADIVISKSASPTNPAPGATVTYTISYQNNGTGPASSIVISDTLGANLTYVAASASNGGVYTTVPVNVLTWSLPALVAGDQAVKTVTFQAVVGSLPSGTVIGNHASIAYTDDTNGETTENPRSNAENVTISAEVWSLTVTPPTLSADNTGFQTIDVGSQLVYTLTLTNTGNTAGTPTFTVTQNAPSAGAALTWVYYADANANGTYEPATDVTTVSSGSSLGSIAVAGSVVIFAVDTVGLNLTDASTHVVDYSYVSTYDSETGSSTTTIAAPIMSITKSVASTEADGTRQPGDVMEYTITVTNAGTGAASNVVVLDNIPSNTTYVANSTTLSVNGGAASPLADGTVYSTGPAKITVSLTVPGKTTSDETRVIKFRVTIN